MKLRLTLMHKLGAAIALIGFVILIIGLSVLIKYSARKDLSEMTEKDLKSGRYVTGTVKSVITVVEGSVIDINADDPPEPAEVLTTDSENGEGTKKTLFLTNLAPASGKLVVLAVDEMDQSKLYIDMYLNKLDAEGESFDGVLVRNKGYDAAIDSFVESMKTDQKLLLDGASVIGSIGDEGISYYVVEPKDFGVSKLVWLIAIPMIMGGIAVFGLAGSPYKKVR